MKPKKIKGKLTFKKNELQSFSENEMMKISGGGSVELIGCVWSDESEYNGNCDPDTTNVTRPTFSGDCGSSDCSQVDCWSIPGQGFGC